MKCLYLIILMCINLSVRMEAKEISSANTKNWYAEAEKLHAGCTYVRSMQGAEKAVLYYSIKEAEESDDAKHFKMYIDVVELPNLAQRGPIHEMLIIDEAYSSYPTCTDVLDIRQEGDRIYCKSEDGTKEWLILDLGLKEGDSFVDGDGECYVVKEVTNYKDTKAKELHLQSENGTKEDTWVEGIGSLQWGFLPGYVAKTVRFFQDVNDSLLVSLWSAHTPDFFVDQSVNDEFFKLQPFKEVEDEETENMGYEDLPEPLSLSCSFIGSDLWVQGYYYLNLYRSYLAVSVSGTLIDVSVHQVTSMNDIKGMRVVKVDVRIPGFKTGTYEVGMAGQKHVTLECKGTPTQIENVKSEIKNGTTIYDLSGRKMTNDVMKGVTIQNGKKVAIK